MRRLSTVLPLALFALATAGAATALAAPPTPSSAAEAPGRSLGIVPVLDQARAARPTRSNNLINHGGPVMQQNRTYAIYWGAGTAWDPGYIATINTFLGDVAADSGKNTNVYWSDTQYSSIEYHSTFVTDYLDTSAYPSNGCTDKATAICLSDAQLQAELARVMGVNGWTASTGGVQNLFLLFTPKGVGSCAGSSCAYTTYCAYHSWIAGADPILYANQPYGAQNYRIYTCDSGQHPNGNSADATLNLVSHEHNEAITDPQGSAWYDSQGYENGDKCAWNFGTALGTTSGGAKFNQLINGNGTTCSRNGATKPQAAC